MASSSIVKTLKYGVIYFYAALTLGLFGWIVLISLKDNRDIFANPLGWPKRFQLDNYLNAWNGANISTYFWNSLLVMVASVGLTVLFAATVAYAVSRFQFRGNALLYLVFLLGLSIPLQSLMLPTFLKMDSLGLRDNLLSLIVVYSAFALPKSVFLLVGFMRGIPKDLEEAGIVDGCGYFGIFSKIILPVSMPGIATVAILEAIGAWNEYVYATVLISTEHLRTLPLGLANFRGEYMSQYGLIAAGTVITMIPVVAVYVLFQEQIVKGLVAGSVKG